jgi:hypothetical protein
MMLFIKVMIFTHFKLTENATINQFFSLEYEATKAINASSYGSVFASSTDLSSSPPGTHTVR